MTHSTHGIPSFIDDALPREMLDRLFALPLETQELFVEEYSQRAKSIPLGYVLWSFSLHYAYLEKWAPQIGLWLAWLLFWPGLAWWLLDLFRTQGLVRRRNAALAEDVLRFIHSAAPPRRLR